MAERKHTKNTAAALADLRNILPADALLTGGEGTQAYGADSSRCFHAPDAVALPASEEQIAAILRIASAHSMPVLPRGAGSATTGASLAELGGIALSTERLDAVVDIDAEGRTATVQAGVFNSTLQERAAKHGLFWPPDPGSAAISTVGGNLATAAAGPRGMKYGGVRESVLGLRAVLASGEVISCGSRAAKYAAGYDLARLLIGSEGTLAVISEATLRLVPLPAATCGTLACFASDFAALDAACALLRAPATPSALEFVDEACVRVLADAGFPSGSGGVLLVQHDGESEEAARSAASAAAALLKQQPGCLSADSRTVADLLAARNTLSPRLRDAAAVKINEDVAVPAGRMADLMRTARAAADEAQARCAVFGHAGAGNLHVHFLLDDSSAAAMARAERAREQVFAFAAGCGGAISGEHGIGITKRRYMHLQCSPATLELMRAVKQAFDPLNILNPGKVLPARTGF